MGTASQNRTVHTLARRAGLTREQVCAKAQELGGTPHLWRLSERSTRLLIQWIERQCAQNTEG